MSNINQIASAIEFMETNLQQPITLADVAEATGYSIYHFCRTFNQIVQHTPYNYLIQRRLSASAHTLRTTTRKIIDIALAYQFNNPETYTRAFKRMFNLSPTQWRKQTQVDERQGLPRFTAQYLHHIQQIQKPRWVEKPAFYIVGLMSRLADTETDTNFLWETTQQALGNLTHEGWYGVQLYPNGWQTTDYFYLAGVGVRDITNLPSAFVIKPLPAMRYTTIHHPGNWETRPLTYRYFYHTWLPKLGRQPLFPLELEVYCNRPTENGQNEITLYIPLERGSKQGIEVDSLLET